MLVQATLQHLQGYINLVLDPAGIGDNTGKVIILGDLQVDGTQTIINSTVVEIDDKLISIAKVPQVLLRQMVLDWKLMVLMQH